MTSTQWMDTLEEEEKSWRNPHNGCSSYANLYYYTRIHPTLPTLAMWNYVLRSETSKVLIENASFLWVTIFL